jgi:SPP1 gp7 family putative phage head morphogenesis protein
VSLKETRFDLLRAYEKYSIDGILDFETMQKFSRLASLEANIIDQIKNIYNETGEILTKNLSAIYLQNYFYVGFLAETASQIKMSFALLSPDVIKEQIQNPISGLTLNDRLKKNRNEIIIRTREQLTQGLIKGESIKDMSTRIKELYEFDVKKSIRIAQTETNRVRNAGKEKGYERAKQKGVEFTKEWIATLDGRTRDMHQKLDGMLADKEGYFTVSRFRAKYPGGFGVAEMDINCRCTTKASFKGLESIVRRENVDGKNIIPYEKYSDWYDNRVAK